MLTPSSRARVRGWKTRHRVTPAFTAGLVGTYHLCYSDDSGASYAFQSVLSKFTVFGARACSLCGSAMKRAPPGCV